MTQRIREMKVHCILFHNITYYAGGTIPWGGDHNEEFGKPSMCDGKIEVLGLTSATLVSRGFFNYHFCGNPFLCAKFVRRLFSNYREFYVNFRVLFEF